ncbi:MAG: MMPL family transporter [Bacteriovoracaceae bacterium]|nr:MMPL family transporter [Bacteriovoracaceae bacterium]
MKPLIFDPRDRPHIYVEKASSQSASVCKVVEIGHEYLVVQGEHALPLRGSLAFEGESYPFDKLDEQKIDSLHYTHLRLKNNSSEDLYRLLLTRLPTEQLSEWLIDQLPNNHPSESFQEISEEEIDNGLIATTFEKIILTLYKRPWLSVFLLLALSIFPAINIVNIKFDPSLDRILIKDSPEMKIYKNSLKLFGSDRSAIIFIQDPDIFNPEKLKLLRDLSWRLQKWPQIEKVHSVFTSSFIRNKDETLYTEPIFQNIGDDSRELLKKIQEDPILHGRLIDVPKGILIISIQLDKDIKILSTIATEIEKEIAPLKKDFKLLYQTGESKMELFNKQEMASSPMIFLPLIALILFLGFAFFIKSIDAFVITIFGTIFSVFWSFGVMTYFDIPIQLMIILIPGITLTLSATEIVHMISSYKTGFSNGLSKEKALSFMSRDIGKAIVLTFSSTSLGFLSIFLSEIQLLEEFAIVSFIALICDFFVTILYFPLHIKFISSKEVPTETKKKKLKIFKLLENKFHTTYLNSFFSSKSLYIVLLFIVINLWFASKVRMDNDSIEMIAPYTQIKKDLTYFKNSIGGMKSIHLVIESEESLLTPKNLSKLWSIHDKINNLLEVKSVQSIAGVLSLLNKEMISGNISDYRVPHSENLISQYMLTLSRDDVDPYITPDKLKANIKIYHDVSSSVLTEEFIKSVEHLVQEELAGHKLGFYLTSRNILNINAGNTIIRSQALSLIAMSIVIICLMTIFFKSIRIGALSLIPNLIPIVGLFGIMGMFNISLNIGTMVVAAITIGIAADDTIHLFSRYFKDRLSDLSPFSTASKSIHEELIPILTTSLTLSLSFSTFVISKIIPVLEFGLLSTYVLILAVISDLYIGPWLLTYFDLFKIKGRENYFRYLIGPRALSKDTDLNQLSYQELFTLLRSGKFEVLIKGTFIPKEEVMAILINGDLLNYKEGNIVKESDTVTQEDTLLFTITKKDLRHLSPNILGKLIKV